MNSDQLARLDASIRNVPDFPKPGIIFKDITPLLADPAMFQLSLDALAETMQPVDKIVALDARGFIFAGALASSLGAGFVPVRKKGKLPYQTESISYDLEYGSATVEMHVDAIVPGERIWLIDDVLATGGTATAAIALIQRLGGNLLGMSFLIELAFLEGRKVLPAGVPAHAVLVY